MHDVQLQDPSLILQRAYCMILCCTTRLFLPHLLNGVILFSPSGKSLWGLQKKQEYLF